MNYSAALDLGTRRIRMSVRGRGAVLDALSATLWRSGRLFARGDEALSFIDRMPVGCEVAYPLQGAVLVREDALSDWFAFLLQTAAQQGLVHHPRLLIACEPTMQLSQLRRLSALALGVGAVSCGLLRADLLAALGAGRNPLGNRAVLVADVGAGHLSATLFAHGRVLACESLPYGLARLDDDILRMLRLKYTLSVGSQTAESLKKANVPDRVAGFDHGAGFPRAIDIAQADVQACCRPYITAIVQLISSVALRASETALPELMQDGLALTGGGAALSGLASLIEADVGLPCKIPENPETCVLRGLERVMDRPDEYESLIQAHQSLLARRAPGGKN